MHATTRGPARPARPARPAARRGMTLIEVMIALVILVGTMLALGGFITRFAHTTTLSGLKATATELAADRVELVKSAPTYTSLEGDYATTEESIAGFPGFRRQTLITRVGGTVRDREDYKIVTVIVSSPALTAPVKKTTIISAY